MKSKIVGARLAMCCRGLTNDFHYILEPDAARHDDDTGCGNTLHASTIAARPRSIVVVDQVVHDVLGAPR
jgi:pullulanase/glycogen debranching enzyme